MPITKRDLDDLQTQFERLKNDLTLLDENFERNLKAVDLSEEELKKIDPDKLPPEVKKLLEEARLSVKQDREDRARAAKSRRSPKGVPRSRGGAIKV